MENSIITQEIRTALGLLEGNEDFTSEINLHIQTALTILNQNGIGLDGFIFTPESTWADFKDPNQLNGNQHFNIVPMYVMTRTKILFDPPPPSNVEFYNRYIDELLWRLRVVYEKDNLIAEGEV